MFENAPEIEIAGLCIDSRCAKANDMYFCMEGMVHDGHEFIDDVIEKGVKCIVHSKPVDDMKKGVAYIQVENVNRTLNRVASMFYGGVRCYRNKREEHHHQHYSGCIFPFCALWLYWNDIHQLWRGDSAAVFDNAGCCTDS